MRVAVGINYIGCAGCCGLFLSRDGFKLHIEFCDGDPLKSQCEAFACARSRYLDFMTRESLTKRKHSSIDGESNETEKIISPKKGKNYKRKDINRLIKSESGTEVSVENMKAVEVEYVNQPDVKNSFLHHDRALILFDKQNEINLMKHEDNSESSSITDQSFNHEESNVTQTFHSNQDPENFTSGDVHNELGHDLELPIADDTELMDTSNSSFGGKNTFDHSEEDTEDLSQSLDLHHMTSEPHQSPKESELDTKIIKDVDMNLCSHSIVGTGNGNPGLLSSTSDPSLSSFISHSLFSDQQLSPGGWNPSMSTPSMWGNSGTVCSNWAPAITVSNSWSTHAVPTMSKDSLHDTSSAPSYFVPETILNQELSVPSAELRAASVERDKKPETETVSDSDQVVCLESFSTPVQTRTFKSEFVVTSPIQSEICGYFDEKFFTSATLIDSKGIRNLNFQNTGDINKLITQLEHSIKTSVSGELNTELVSVCKTMTTPSVTTEFMNHLEALKGGDTQSSEDELVIDESPKILRYKTKKKRKKITSTADTGMQLMDIVNKKTEHSKYEFYFDLCGKHFRISKNDKTKQPEIGVATKDGEGIENNKESNMVNQASLEYKIDKIDKDTMLNSDNASNLMIIKSADVSKGKQSRQITYRYIRVERKAGQYQYTHLKNITGPSQPSAPVSQSGLHTDPHDVDRSSGSDQQPQVDEPNGEDNTCRLEKQPDVDEPHGEDNTCGLDKQPDVDEPHVDNSGSDQQLDVEDPHGVVSSCGSDQQPEEHDPCGGDNSGGSDQQPQGDEPHDGHIETHPEEFITIAPEIEADLHTDSMDLPDHVKEVEFPLDPGTDKLNEMDSRTSGTYKLNCAATVSNISSEELKILENSNGDNLEGSQDLEVRQQTFYPSASSEDTIHNIDKGENSQGEGENVAVCENKAVETQIRIPVELKRPQNIETGDTDILVDKHIDRSTELTENHTSTQDIESVRYSKNGIEPLEATKGGSDEVSADQQDNEVETTLSETESENFSQNSSRTTPLEVTEVETGSKAAAIVKDEEAQTNLSDVEEGTSTESVQELDIPHLIEKLAPTPRYKKLSGSQPVSKSKHSKQLTQKYIQQIVQVSAKDTSDKKYCETMMNGVMILRKISKIDDSNPSSMKKIKLNDQSSNVFERKDNQGASRQGLDSTREKSVMPDDPRILSSEVSDIRKPQSSLLKPTEKNLPKESIDSFRRSERRCLKKSEQNLLKTLESCEESTRDGSSDSTQSCSRPTSQASSTGSTKSTRKTQPKCNRPSRHGKQKSRMKMDVEDGSGGKSSVTDDCDPDFDPALSPESDEESVQVSFTEKEKQAMLTLPRDDQYTKQYTGGHVVYICTLCKQKLLSLVKLRNHLALTHNDGGEFSCDHCEFTTLYRRRFKAHYKRHTRDRYICPYCPTFYKDNSSLTRHINIKHLEQSNFECSQCGYVAIDNQRLTDHMRTHSGEMLVCRYEGCEYKTASYRTYCEHEKRHEPEFLCGECGYSTSNKQTFTKHISTHSTHSQQRMFQCSVCNFRARTKQQVLNHGNNLHVSNESRDKYYACDRCSFLTKYPSSITSHIYVHIGLHPFKCSVCDFSSVSVSAVNRHAENKHPDHVITTIKLLNDIQPIIASDYLVDNPSKEISEVPEFEVLEVDSDEIVSSAPYKGRQSKSDLNCDTEKKKAKKRKATSNLCD